MKIIFGAPLLHLPLYGQNVDYDAAQREVMEIGILRRIAALKPQKIFLEGWASGVELNAEDLGYTSDELTGERPTMNNFACKSGKSYIPSPGSSLSKSEAILAGMIRQGTCVEGMDHLLLNRLHRFILMRNYAVNVWIRSRQKDVLKSFIELCTTVDPPILASVRNLCGMFLVRIASRAWNGFCAPPGYLCLRLRDICMARAIMKASVEGTNVALYGAAHNPLRLIYRGRFQKHYLVNEVEIRQAVESIRWDAQWQAELRGMVDGAAIPEDLKDRIKASWLTRPSVV